MVKVASIDLGSNSTRMLIANINNGSIDPILKMYNVTRMGDKLDDGKEISVDSQKRVISTLAKFFKEINKYGIQNIHIVGTATLRDASNSQEFTEKILKKFGVEVEVISGEEEGILTSLGVLNSLNNIKNYLIVDIGGRSTEFIFEKDSNLKSISLNMGVVSLGEKYFETIPISEDRLNSAISYIQNKLDQINIPTEKLLIGVAGTFSTIGSIYLNQNKFDEKQLHSVELSKKVLDLLTHEALSMSEAKMITKFKSMDPKRSKTIQPGIVLANQISIKYNVSSIKVSISDILEGLILKKY